MSEKEHNQLQKSCQPRWKRFHHSWIFWIFLLLMLVAIMFYITSVDFAFAPR